MVRVKNKKEYDSLCSYIETNYDKVCSNIRNKSIDDILNEEGEDNETLSDYNKEDFITCMYLMAIKNEDILMLNELDKLNENKENNSTKEDHINQKRIDIINMIYQRDLLSQEIIRKIVLLNSRYYNFEISFDFMYSVLKNWDDKLFNIIYQNFVFDNSFIKMLLYQYQKNKNNESHHHHHHIFKIFLSPYKKYKNRKNIIVSSHSKLNNIIDKEINKISFDTKDKNKGISLLDLSMLIGNSNITKNLIKHCTNVNKENEYGDTYLYLACERKYENIVKILIENGADVNKNNKDGKTPLMCACEKGHENVVKILIENGANVNKKDKNGKTPLFWAYIIENKNIMDMLIENGAHVNKNTKSEMDLLKAEYERELHCKYPFMGNIRCGRIFLERQNIVEKI